MQGFMREREAFPTQLDRQATKSQDEPWNREAMSNLFLALVPLFVSESCQYTPDTHARQKRL